MSKLNIDKRSIFVLSQNESEASFHGVASICHLENGIFIAANYQEIALLDLTRKLITRLDIHIYKEVIAGSNETPTENSSILPYCGLLNPTGVHCSKSGLIGIANYKGDNILLGRVKESFFLVEKIISLPNNSGPENLWIDEERNLIVSADYDGNTATAVDIVTNEIKWSVSLSSPHGVCIHKNTCFVTTLGHSNGKGPSIVRINVDTGNIEATTSGQAGWNSATYQFLWPTSIITAGENLIAVSDAQTGFISIYEADNLLLVDRFGGNGISDDNLHYPYSLCTWNDKLVITSNRRNEIHVADHINNVINQSFIFSSAEYISTSDLIAENQLSPAVDFSGSNHDGYKYKDSIKIFGVDFYPELGKFTSQLDQSLLFNNSSSLYIEGNYVYLVQAAKIGNCVIFLSSSAEVALFLFDEPSKPPLLRRMIIPLDTWLMKKTANGNSDYYLLSRNGDLLSVNDILGRLSVENESIYSNLKKNGALDIGDIQTTVNSSLDFSQIIKSLDQVANTPLEKQFCFVLDYYRQGIFDETTIGKATDSLISGFSMGLTTSLEIFCFACLYSGRVIKSNKSMIKFHNILEAYYPGHDVNSLNLGQTAPYLSAISIKTSNLRFQINKYTDFKFYALRIISFSPAEAGKSYLFFLKSLTSIEKLVNSESLEFFEYNEVKIFKSQQWDDYEEIRLCLQSGGVQNRLLIRSVSPIYLKTFDDPVCDNLIKICAAVALATPYGSGILSLPKDFSNIENNDKKLFLKEHLKAQTNLHCGNKALLFLLEIESLNINKFKVYDLHSFLVDGAIHTVIELCLNNRYITVDPTLGALYECSVQSLIDGESIYLFNSENPDCSCIRRDQLELSNYYGTRFFFKSTIKFCIESLQDLITSNYEFK